MIRAIGGAISIDFMAPGIVLAILAVWLGRGTVLRRHERNTQARSASEGKPRLRFGLVCFFRAGVI
jgi:hypothetical protein